MRRGVAAEREVAAVCAALEPYQWRSFTPDLVARCVLGALDRRRVLDLLAEVPGSEIGDPCREGPVERGDVRAEVLVEFLTSHRWQGLTLAAVCSQLLNELDAWWSRRQWLEAELARLVDGER